MMTDGEYISIMKEVIQKHSLLNFKGALPFEPDKQSSEELQRDRDELLNIHHKTAFIACLNFFNNMKATNKRRHPNAPNSYTLKHVVEKLNPEIGHVPEGILIAAGYHVGFRYNQVKTSQRNFWLDKATYNKFMQNHGLETQYKM